VLLCVVVSYCGIPAHAFAQDLEQDNAEPEFESTPTTLVELLGEDGFDALHWDVWTVVTQDNQPLALIRSQAYDENECLVFVEYEEIVDTEMNAYVWVYSREGDFIEYRAWYRDRARNGWDGEGDWAQWVRLDKDVVEVLVLGRDRKHWELREHELHESDAIPARWIPLAIQYHISREHENFIIESYTGTLPPRTPIHDVIRYQDLGEEVIVVNGEEISCHVIETWQSFWPRNHPEPDRSTPLVSYWAYESGGQLVFGDRADLAETDYSEDRVDPDNIPDCFERFEVMTQGDAGEDVFGPLGMTEAERADRFEALAAEGDAE